MESALARAVEEEPEFGADRHYQGAVSFEQAFDLRTIIALAKRTVPKYPLFLVMAGLAIALGRFIIPISFSLPLMRSTESLIAGSFVGMGLHSFFAISVGTFLSAYVQVAVLAEVGRWVRGEEEPDLVAALSDWEMGLQGIVYEVFAYCVALTLMLPFIFLGLVFAAYDMGGIAKVCYWLALVFQLVGWVGTRPGQWGMAIDGLPPKYAILQSFGATLNHPVSLAVLFLAYGVAIVAGGPALCLGSFLVVGAFHCGVGGAWVLFGSSPEEIDANELLAGLVEFERIEPL